MKFSFKLKYQYGVAFHKVVESSSHDPIYSYVQEHQSFETF